MTRQWLSSQTRWHWSSRGSSELDFCWCPWRFKSSACKLSSLAWSTSCLSAWWGSGFSAKQPTSSTRKASRSHLCTTWLIFASVMESSCCKKQSDCWAIAYFAYSTSSTWLPLSKTSTLSSLLGYHASFRFLAYSGWIANMYFTLDWHLLYLV